MFDQIHGEFGVKIAVGLFPVAVVSGHEVAKVDAEHGVGTRKSMLDAVFGEHSSQDSLNVGPRLLNRRVSI